MPSVRLTKIDKKPDGRVCVSFGKRTTEFASMEALRASVQAALTMDDLELLALRLALHRQPNLGNPALLEGRTVNVDFGSVNWGTIS